jgi:hypothetical protein
LGGAARVAHAFVSVERLFARAIGHGLWRSHR